MICPECKFEVGSFEGKAVRHFSANGNALCDGTGKEETIIAAAKKKIKKVVKVAKKK